MASNVYEKSLETLKGLIAAQKTHEFEFVLIGGWATWVYNPYMMSKDIDLILRKEDFWKLKTYLLRAGFSETRGLHLGKKGFAMLHEGDKIELDVYDDNVAGIAVSGILERAVERGLEGETLLVASLTDLVGLKIHSAVDRMGSSKGEKDLSDILALLVRGYDAVDWEGLAEFVDRRGMENVLRVILADFRQAQRLYPLDMQTYSTLRRVFKKRRLI